MATHPFASIGDGKLGTVPHLPTALPTLFDFGGNRDSSCAPGGIRQRWKPGEDQPYGWCLPNGPGTALRPAGYSNGEFRCVLPDPTKHVVDKYPNTGTAEALREPQLEPRVSSFTLGNKALS